MVSNSTRVQDMQEARGRHAGHRSVRARRGCRGRRGLGMQRRSRRNAASPPLSWLHRRRWRTTRPSCSGDSARGGEDVLRATAGETSAADRASKNRSLWDQKAESFEAGIGDSSDLFSGSVFSRGGLTVLMRVWRFLICRTSGLEYKVPDCSRRRSSPSPLQPPHCCRRPSSCSSEHFRIDSPLGCSPLLFHSRPYRLRLLRPHV